MCGQLTGHYGSSKSKSKSGSQDCSFRVCNLEIILLGGVTFFLILGMLIGMHNNVIVGKKSAKGLVVALIANTACVMCVLWCSLLVHV